jgi:hypothetical protein
VLKDAGVEDAPLPFGYSTYPRYHPSFEIDRDVALGGLGYSNMVYSYQFLHYILVKVAHCNDLRDVVAEAASNLDDSLCPS